MSVKSSLISALEKNIGREVSGQALADSLGVTRAAVWKAAKVLQSQGYPITATPNKGYMLEETSDVISKEGISRCLDDTLKDLKIIVLKSVDSTNIYGKNLASELGGKPALVVALEQTAGIGRRGHSFYSPRDTGIYMSLVLYPTIKQPVLMTIAAAIAVCNTIEETTSAVPKIKWVNDIFVNGKKVCGILTQGIIDFESQKVDTAIIGIGVNLQTKDFPKDVESVATSVFPDGATKNQFIASIASKLYNCLKADNPIELISAYKERLFVLGQEVTYTIDGQSRSGIAVDINQMGNLIVETPSGTDVLTAGEISIKPSSYV